MITSVDLARPEVVEPGSFESSRHYYPRVLNAHIHPLASFFLNLSHRRIISRYCHLNPLVDPVALKNVLEYQPKYFYWGGVDLIHSTTAEGNRQMVLIETNSSPSGHKSMPLMVDHHEQGSYRSIIESTLVPAFRKQRQSKGALAVLYDKNYMENSGYAATLADCFNESVYLIPCFSSDERHFVRFQDNMLQIRLDPESPDWIPVRAAHRYVTQKPWSRIPVNSKTFLMNPVVVCLAGGRNKLTASVAYDMLNADLAGTGLEIVAPETIREVGKAEVPLILKTLGGKGVVKVPYSNAGQGVYTITSQEELDEFKSLDFPYDRFIVQSLIGNYRWSSESRRGRFYQVGTVPNKKNQIFVADVRMMIGATESGYYPFVVYSRRAKEPLANELVQGTDSWDMLVTNLSVKLGEDKWDSDTKRLLLLDRRDFNTIGVGLDGLISGFIQGVLAMMAIDRMAVNLVNSKGRFRMKLFRSLNNDPALHSEIMLDAPNEGSTLTQRDEAFGGNSL